MSPHVSLSAAVLAAACLVAGAGSPAASAAPTGSFADLAAAFADPATVGGEVTLEADLAQGASPKLTLAAGQSLTLDLNGFDVAVQEVTLADGSSLTITDTSTGAPGTFAASWDSVDPYYPNVEAAIGLRNAALSIEGRAHVTADAGDPDSVRAERRILVSAIGVTAGTGTVTIGGDAVVDAAAWETAIAVGGAAVREVQPPTGTLVVEDNARVTAHSHFGAGIGGRTAQDGGDITITDHAVVEATSYQGAGIGGGVNGGSGGTVRIDGDAQVTAVSKASASGGSLGFSAGIGGGLPLQRDAGAWFEGGNGGDVTIGGNAVVTATSERLGAGIGAAEYAIDGGSLHVMDNATVTATSGMVGAGIGGGGATSSWAEDGGGADVILDGGTTTAINAPTSYRNSSAVGFGDGGTDFGSLQVNSPATLVIPDGAELRIPEGVTVTGDGEIRGDGNVVNEGAVVLPTENLDWADLSFAPNNYLTTFHANGGEGTAEVRTFATSFNAGARTVPDAPTRAGFDHLGWADTVDGGATRALVTFDADTPLTGDRTLYAQWLSGTATAATAAATATPGQDVPVHATVTAADPAAGVPQGTAQLFVDDQAVGDPVPVTTDGTAELTYPGASAGNHTVRVEFIPGEVIWSASTSPDLGMEITAAPAADTTQDATQDTTGNARSGNLATTGAGPIALWAGLAVVLLGAGIATVLIVRRRARTH